LLFGVAGLAQISGSWTGKLQLLPSIDFSTTLTLTYSVAGFDITSESKFSSSGFDSQKFSISGSFGPMDVSGWMKFDPTVPEYDSSQISASLDFAGVALSLTVLHDTDLTYCQTGSVEMLYTFKASVDPVTLKVRFLDCCDGIEFYDLTLTLDDLSLCCGLVYDFTLYFTKDGFEYVKFVVDPLFELCCDISFGVTVEFGVDYKSVTPSFTWGGISGCVTVWGDVQPKIEEVGVEGWQLYGYKIYCELAECYELEIVTAFVPEEVNKHLDPDWILEDYEFEYIRFGACGPACCGGTWTLDAGVFFDNGGGLFGISRYKVIASVPIMDNLTLGLEWEFDLGATPPTTLTLTWDFTF
jgi:hypothetical protein